MKIRREKTLALFVVTCMVFAMCMTGFVTTVDATTTIVETGYISQDGWAFHFISIPEGPEVEIKLIWEEPKHDVIDLDFRVPGYAPGEPLWGWIGGSMRNPEIAYLSDDPTDLLIVVNGWYVPGDGVDYRLEVNCGSDVIPEPYAESGGQTVGDLTSFHVASRTGIWHSDKNGAPGWIYESNPLRQAITVMSFYNFWMSPLYYGCGWAGPAYYAGDPLLVGGMAWSWPMDEYTRKEAVAEMEAMNVQYIIDDIPLEDLGHATEKLIRADMVNREWYYRYPSVIFKPGELYDVLPDREDGLHTLEGYAFGGLWFIGDFYLL